MAIDVQIVGNSAVSERYAGAAVPGRAVIQGPEAGPCGAPRGQRDGAHSPGDNNMRPRATRGAAGLLPPALGVWPTDRRTDYLPQRSLSLRSLARFIRRFLRAIDAYITASTLPTTRYSITVTVVSLPEQNIRNVTRYSILKSGALLIALLIPLLPQFRSLKTIQRYSSPRPTGALRKVT